MSRRFWAVARGIFEQTKPIRTARIRKTPEIAAATPQKTPKIPSLGPRPGDPPAAAKAPEPAKKVINHPPGRLAPFDAGDPNEPTLAQKHRPDLPASHERHDAFHGEYHSESKVLSMRHMRGESANVNFHGTMANKTAFVSKPHSTAGDYHEPEHWGSRHSATHAIMSHMGSSHMVLPGFETKIHDLHRIPGADPDNDDSPEKRKRMARTHAGQKALVVQHEPNHTAVSDATPEQLDKVDGEHRLHGMVMHLLQSNADGHRDNVLLHKSGHPILIDHDLTFDSSLTRTERLKKKGEEGDPMTAIRSVFGPGGSLDYSKKITNKIDSDFPARIKKTLEWIALGGHEEGEHKLPLRSEDSSELTKNARELLKHGLEGTLARRKMLREHT